MPTTLTQLYTWVMLVFSNQWHHTEESGLNLDTHTSTFLKGCEDTGRCASSYTLSHVRFAKLCYHLVQSGSIKKQAELDPSGERILFPGLDLELDLGRAQTFGMMVVSQEGATVETEFRHLSLAEYLTALHVHITGEPLKVDTWIDSFKMCLNNFLAAYVINYAFVLSGHCMLPNHENFLKKMYYNYFITLASVSILHYFHHFLDPLYYNSILYLVSVKLSTSPGINGHLDS